MRVDALRLLLVKPLLVDALRLLLIKPLLFGALLFEPVLIGALPIKTLLLGLGGGPCGLLALGGDASRLVLRELTCALFLQRTLPLLLDLFGGVCGGRTLGRGLLRLGLLLRGLPGGRLLRRVLGARLAFGNLSRPGRGRPLLSRIVERCMRRDKLRGRFAPSLLAGRLLVRLSCTALGFGSAGCLLAKFGLATLRLGARGRHALFLVHA